MSVQQCTLDGTTAALHQCGNGHWIMNRRLCVTAKNFGSRKLILIEPNMKQDVHKWHEIQETQHRMHS